MIPKLGVNGEAQNSRSKKPIARVGFLGRGSKP